MEIFTFIIVAIVGVFGYLFYKGFSNTRCTADENEFKQGGIVVNSKILKQMKKTIFRNSLIIFLTTIVGCSDNSKNHIGEWESVIRGNGTMDLIFKNSEDIVGTSGFETFGGENYLINGVKYNVKYEMDYSKKPMWFDIVYYKVENNEETGRIMYLVDFLTEDKMRLVSSNNPTEIRPKSFEDTNIRPIVLNRVK